MIRYFIFFLLSAALAGAFESGGKSWPDSFSISGVWAHTALGTGAKGLKGSSNWSLNGSAVQLSPGVWKYRVSFSVKYDQEKRKDTTTTIPNAYKFASKAYVRTHYSFLPIPSTDQGTWGAAGTVSVNLNTPAYWDPVPTDGVYTVTGDLVGGSGSATPSTFTRSVKINGEKYQYNFRNDTDQIRTYQIFDGNGDKIFHQRLAPGEKTAGNFTGSGSGSPHANSGPSGGSGNLDGTLGWKIEPSGGLGYTNDYDPAKDYVDPEFSSPEVISPVPNQGKPETPEKTPDPLVWNRPTDQNDALKDDVFRQGTKAITDRLDALINKPSAGGGGATDMSGVHSRLDTANSHLTDIKNDGRVSGDVSAFVFDETLSDQAFLPFNMTDVYQRAVSKLPQPPQIIAPGSFSGTVTVPFAFPGIAAKNMHINFQQFDSGINIFKFIVRAALSVAFFFMCVRAIKQGFA